MAAHLRSTITMHMHPRPFYHLRAKLCAYMRPKCHPIFYDSKINSLATVGLNAYQAFLLCAMKFHCYVCGMPAISHLDPNYFLDMIQNSFRYTIIAIWTIHSFYDKNQVDCSKNKINKCMRLSIYSPTVTSAVHLTIDLSC